MLDGADWTYEMSDDQSVWRRGRAEMGKLIRIADESPAHTQLFMDFSAHYSSDWHTKEDGSFDYDKGRKVPKPKLEAEAAFRTGEST